MRVVVGPACGEWVTTSSGRSVAWFAWFLDEKAKEFIPIGAASDARSEIRVRMILKPWRLIPFRP